MDDNTNEIKVFGNDDESLTALGQLLSNDTSRKIIRLLSEEEMYANQISKRAGVGMNLVLHHIKKLEDAGIIIVTHKKIIKKGIDHKYYKIIPNLFVANNQTATQIKENGFLKKLFREGIKIAVISFGCISSWRSAIPNKIQETDVGPASPDELKLIPWNSIEEPSNNFFLIPIIIIGCSLFLIWFSKKTR